MNYIKYKESIHIVKRGMQLNKKEYSKHSHITIAVRCNLKCDLNKTHHRTKHPVLQRFCNSLFCFYLRRLQQNTKEAYNKMAIKSKICN